MTQASFDLNSRIVAMRKSGKSCRETVAILGVKEWRVWKAMSDADDTAMLEEAELLDLEAWAQTARAGKLGWEGRKPEAYLSRLERALRLARRRG